MLRVAEHWSGTDTGRQRRANEDSLLVRAPLFVVADGMGGAQAGEVASHMAVDTFKHGLPTHAHDGDDAGPLQSLVALAVEANGRINERSQADPRHAGMGTTITAMYVGEDDVSVIHVGDSRAYCLREGELLRLTDDHSLVDELIRQGRLTPEEAEEHPQRSVITRALGPEPSVEVDARSFRGRSGDVYLLCSDGLTTMVDEDRLRATLTAHDRLRDAGEELIAAANEAGGKDNITVVLARLEELGSPAPPGGADGHAETTAAHAHTAVGGAGTAAGSAGTAAGSAGTAAGGAGTAATHPYTDSGPVGATAAHAPGGSTAERGSGGGRAIPETSAEPGPDRGTAAATATHPVVRRRQPRAGAPRPGTRPQGRAGRRWRRVRGPMVLLAVLAVVAVGAYLASQSVYFIGTNQRGLVAVFRGVPYELPGGIKLYSTDYVSGVSASTLSPSRRQTLLDHTLRSESKAAELVRLLEMGQLSER